MLTIFKNHLIKRVGPCSFVGTLLGAAAFSQDCWGAYLQGAPLIPIYMNDAPQTCATR